MHEDAAEWLSRGAVLRQCALLAMLVVCAYTDLAKGKIYNVVTLTGLFLGFAISFALDGLQSGNHQIVGSLYAALLGGGALFVIYLFGGFGAGDVKLMAAIGALIARPQFVIWALVYTAVIGAAISIGMLVWKGRLLDGLKRSFRLLVTFRRGAREIEKREELFLPYGFAISAGTMWAWMTFVALAPRAAVLAQ